MRFRQIGIYPNITTVFIERKLAKLRKYKENPYARYRLPPRNNQLRLKSVLLAILISTMRSFRFMIGFEAKSGRLSVAFAGIV